MGRKENVEEQGITKVEVNGKEYVLVDPERYQFGKKYVPKFGKGGGKFSRAGGEGEDEAMGGLGEALQEMAGRAGHMIKRTKSFVPVTERRREEGDSGGEGRDGKTGETDWQKTMNEQECLNQVKKIMRDNLYERRVVGKKGKLEMTRLAHYRTSKRLFTKPEDQKGQQYHFDIIVDFSGSMHGERISCAVKSAISIGQILNDVANIRIKVFNGIERTFTLGQFMAFVQPDMKHNYQQATRLTGDSYFVFSASDKRGMIVSKREIDLYRGKDGREVQDSGGADGENREIGTIMRSFDYMMKQDGKRAIFTLLDGGMCGLPYQHEAKELGRKVTYYEDRDVLEYNEENYINHLKRVKKQGIPNYAFAIQSGGVDSWFDSEDIYHINEPGQIFGALVDAVRRVVKVK